MSLTFTRSESLTLLLTPLGALLLSLVLTGKAGQSFFYLLLYIFLTYLGVYGAFVAVTSATVATTFATTLILIAVVAATLLRL